MSRVSPKFTQCLHIKQDGKILLLMMETLYLSLWKMECGTILLQIEIIELVIEYRNYSRKIRYLSEVKTIRPRVSVGLNPTVHIFNSGSRPRSYYLFTLGLNPRGYDLTFWVRTQSILFSTVGLNPTVFEIVFWVQTQR